MKKKEIYNYIYTNILTTNVEFDEDTDLFKYGVIDSMGVMELVAFLEEKYNLNLDAKQMTADNFRTVNSIVCLITEDVN
jgi:acyl carrier protein